MVSPNPKEETQVYNIRISSVGPGRVTGEHVVHEPTNMDLAMKLHYLKTVYYFRSQAVDGLSTMDIKEAIFTWLNRFYPTCGRFRRAESGRAYIKCNDCGARFLEAQCGKNLDEWMEVEEKEEVSNKRLLVPNQVIGPELHFSPLVLFQLTRFRCGGVSVGLSWAHVLGDPFSAADFMNAWGQVMRPQKPAQPLKQAQTPTKPKTYPDPSAQFKHPLSVKRVGPVEDHWMSPNNCKMEAFSLNLSAKQMNHLQSEVSGQGGTNPIPVFESICALIWKIVAKIRNGPEPKVVTICKKDSHGQREKGGILGNGQVISIVEAEFSVTEAEPKELAEMVINGAEDERSRIEEAMEREKGLSDFIVYGANLTFVDLEGANLYGLEFNGQNPIYVGYDVDGIGEEGVVLVIPGPKDGAKVVTLIMPESEVLELKSELKREFSIA